VAMVVLPMTSANPRSDRGVDGASGNIGEPHNRAPAPTSLYSAAIVAHQHGSVWRPDQGVEVLSSRWTRSGTEIIEINLTFSSLISTLLLTLYFVHYSFHHGSVHRACFIIMAQLPIESDIYDILLCFETNSFPFGPLIIQES
jgi:hypothetical protein